MNTVTYTKEMTSCLDCPNHKVMPDPSPDDWFNYDDEKTVCFHEKFGKAGKTVSSMNRPYETKRFSGIPDWCPLLKKQHANTTDNAG